VVRRCNDRLVDDDTIDLNELSDSMLPNRAQYIHVANHECRRPRKRSNMLIEVPRQAWCPKPLLSEACSSPRRYP
jgi:hypothetical protein